MILKLAIRSVTLELRAQVLELLHLKAFEADTISSCYDTLMIINVIKNKIYWICIKRTTGILENIYSIILGYSEKFTNSDTPRRISEKGTFS